MSNKNVTLSTTDKSPENDKISIDGSTLYNFKQQGKGKWRIQNDIVMGGRSNSELKMTTEGTALFSGRVSLENNGGFCSIHQTISDNPFVVNENHSAFVLSLKGDGKNYNFRVRTPNGRHSYASTFSTKGGNDWEKITIPFSSMEATYRGQQIFVPNYAGENVVEMQLLIGNKKEESFTIEIESIDIR